MALPFLHLTFPKSHERDELKPYFEAFKDEHPDVFRILLEADVAMLWVYDECTPKEQVRILIDNPVLQGMNKVINQTIIGFLKPRCQWDTGDALTSACSDFLQLALAEATVIFADQKAANT